MFYLSELFTGGTWHGDAGEFMTVLYQAAAIEAFWRVAAVLVRCAEKLLCIMSDLFDWMTGIFFRQASAGA